MESKQELNNPSGSKLDSANLLILGMEGLLPAGRLPVSRAALTDAGTKKNAIDRQISGAALTRVVLYPIVVELVVKHIWEQQQGKTAEHHHDVHRLFKVLRPDTRCHIESLYYECCVAYKNAIQVGKRQHGSDVVAVEMANLEEALHWNKDAVKNFKYEMTLRGHSVPTGIFWKPEHHFWVVRNTFPNFAIELTRWAAHHSFTRLSP